MQMDRLMSEERFRNYTPPLCTSTKTLISKLNQKCQDKLLTNNNECYQFWLR